MILIYDMSCYKIDEMTCHKIVGKVSYIVLLWIG